MDGGHSDHELLWAYFADRDVACPRCRYNLRGAGGSRCPECGEQLRLTIAARSRPGYVLFLLLAFGWVALAGGMNAYRQFVLTHKMLSGPPSTVRLSAQRITIQRRGAAPDPIIFEMASAPAQYTIKNGQLLPAGSTPTGWAALNWSAVPVSDWVHLG